MLANTKLVRKFARFYNGGEGWGYGGTYTDRCKRDKGLRHVAFRMHNKAQADKLAEELQFALFTTGYTNKVKRTSSNGRDYGTGGGEYVRVIATLA